MFTLSITRPDDWHVHFRDKEALIHTAAATAQHFGRALIMPNLQPALTNLLALTQYHQRILAAVGTNHLFTPYMTLYLTETINPDDLVQAKKYPHILGAKLYPAGATTHSDQGIQSIQALYPLFDLMQASDLVLQIHGEVTHGDIFERETLFIEEYLRNILLNFPRLRIVLEHISSKEAVTFVTEAPNNVAATITPHHLLYNRNQLLVGGVKPHYYCLPILKHERDQIALQQAAVSGNPKFFAGTDSAPHSQAHKECACGCAGIYSAPYALALYAQVFDKLNHLEKLDAFMGHFGALFYQLPTQSERIELIKQKQVIPSSLPFGQTHVIPIEAGNTIEWSVYAPE